MSQLKLFGLRETTCTQRALAVLEEVSVPYELVTTSIEQMKSADYIANKHPFGKVPSFQDGDYTIFESRAIVRYVASVYDKNNTLYPSDAKIRGIIEQWISVEQCYYNSAEDLAWQLVIFVKRRGLPRDEAKIKDAEERLEKVLAVLDDRLAKSTYLAGENFTVADIVYLPYTHLILTELPQYAELYGKFKNFMRWWQLVSNRASWKTATAQQE